MVHVRPLPVATFSHDSTAHFTYAFAPQDSAGTQYSWTFGDGDSAQIAAPVHHYDTTGTYIVTLHISDSLGCDNYAVDTVVIPAAVVGPNGLTTVSASDILVYPNPASTVVYIEAAGNGDLLTLTDNLGQKVLSQTLTGHTNTIAVEALAPGVYTMTISGAHYVRYVKWIKN
jgi:PKD repeat protein